MIRYAIGGALSAFIIFVVARLGVITQFNIELTHPIVIDFLIVISASAAISLFLYKSIAKKYPDTLDLLHLFCFIIFFMIVAGYTILRFTPEYQIALSILVTGTLVGMGWWIQAITAAANNRRSHTLNIVMNTRTSSEYQYHLKAGARLFKDGRHVAQELAAWRCTPDKAEFQKAKIDGDLKEAINGLLFTLNYFEFLAQGIRYRDLDEGLLKECFSSFLSSLEKRGFHIIVEAQKSNPKHFEGIIYLSKRWNGSSIIEEHRSTPGNAQIGIPFPSKKTVKDILKGKDVHINSVNHEHQT